MEVPLSTPESDELALERIRLLKSRRGPQTEMKSLFNKALHAVRRKNKVHEQGQFSPEILGEALEIAALEGNPPPLKSLIALGEGSRHKEYRALEMAATNGHSQTVDFLILLGANDEDKLGRTLHCASHSEHVNLAVNSVTVHHPNVSVGGVQAGAAPETSRHARSVEREHRILTRPNRNSLQRRFEHNIYNAKVNIRRPPQGVQNWFDGLLEEEDEDDTEEDESAEAGTHLEDHTRHRSTGPNSARVDRHVVTEKTSDGAMIGVDIQPQNFNPVSHLSIGTQQTELLSPQHERGQSHSSLHSHQAGMSARTRESKVSSANLQSDSILSFSSSEDEEDASPRLLVAIRDNLAAAIDDEGEIIIGKANYNRNKRHMHARQPSCVPEDDSSRSRDSTATINATVSSIGLHPARSRRKPHSGHSAYQPEPHKLMAVTEKEEALLNMMRRKRAAIAKHSFTEGYRTALKEEKMHAQKTRQPPPAPIDFSAASLPRVSGYLSTRKPVSPAAVSPGLLGEMLEAFPIPPALKGCKESTDDSLSPTSALPDSTHREHCVRKSKASDLRHRSSTLCNSSAASDSSPPATTKSRPYYLSSLYLSFSPLNITIPSPIPTSNTLASPTTTATTPETEASQIPTMTPSHHANEEVTIGMAGSIAASSNQRSVLSESA
ncbi:hypothetical protein H2199_009026 [Coniosporium tulheliwenetii]|uniref:Uncharacterized protein n=1 Tax=Coniosporium tulheliwenetii TaxID=3383036 RepID=A0ACC2YG87_9PEZI|nr:hypothetical protein H2199_009026 [Cladosporium sp. JES 115]